MQASPEDVEALDRLVHEPARLVILTTLRSCASADFTFLGRITGLTNGNLSAHLTKLEAAHLVAIEKRFIDRHPNTNVTITREGRRAVERHWAALDRIRTVAKARPSPSGSEAGPLNSRVASRRRFVRQP